MSDEYDEAEADLLRADARIERKAFYSYCGHCELTGGAHRIGCPNSHEDSQQEAEQ